MAERDRSPPLPVSSHCDLNTTDEQHLKFILSQNNEQVVVGKLAPGTYVVKVAKDQIYHVQSIRNSGKFDSHNQRPTQTKKDHPCRSFCRCFCSLLMLLIILTLVGSLLSSLFSILLKPKDPRFNVHLLQLRNSSRPDERPQYELSLEVHNPNPNVEIFYKEGGAAYLSSRQLEIASGVYPVFSQKSKNTAMVKMVLEGFSDTLPKEVQSSVSNDRIKVHAAFSLELKIPVRMKQALLFSGTMGLNVHCQIIVDTLAQETRILSEKCDCKR